jgi:hypothetical protein
MEEARSVLGPTQALCDIISAEPLDTKIQFQPETWERQRQDIQRSLPLRRARDALDGLYPLHFPVAFPEVFLRARSGFDVIVGNPPWEKVHAEDHGFWARHFPGLRGMAQSELESARAKLRTDRPDLAVELEREIRENDRIREILVSSPAYPGIGKGHADLYKAFCWRFWRLVARRGGRIGVVLPRSAMSAKGSETFRKAVFAGAADMDLTMLLNRAGWVFDEAEHRYTIALTVITRGAVAGKTIGVRGPFANLDSFQAAHNAAPARFMPIEVMSWNDSASLPMLPSERSVEIFAQLREAPRLDLNDPDSWRARPEQEMNSTTQKPLMDLNSKEKPEGFWPVYKGESFDIWTPDAGEFYAYADPDLVLPWLYAKRLRSGKRQNGGVHAEFPARFLQNKKTLACLRPRLAFRRISRATDTRTIRTCLIPPDVVCTDVAPVIHWPRGDERDQAFLLGMLSSIPLDWYARRFVETHVDHFVFNPLPIPRPPPTDARWQRVVALAGRLAAPDRRFATWATAVGVEHGPLREDEKHEMIAELDALAARLYGLTERQLTHVFETFHEGWDYDERLKAVLKHFNRQGQNRRNQNYKGSR